MFSRSESAHRCEKRLREGTGWKEAKVRRWPRSGPQQMACQPPTNPTCCESVSRQRAKAGLLVSSLALLKLRGMTSSDMVKGQPHPPVLSRSKPVFPLWDCSQLWPCLLQHGQPSTVFGRFRPHLRVQTALQAVTLQAIRGSLHTSCV